MDEQAGQPPAEQPPTRFELTITAEAEVIPGDPAEQEDE